MPGSTYLKLFTACPLLKLKAVIWLYFGWLADLNCPMMRAHIRKQTKLLFQKITAEIKQPNHAAKPSKNLDLRSNDRDARSAHYAHRKNLGAVQS